MICPLHGENPSPGVRNRCTVCQRADFAEADAILQKRFAVGWFGRWRSRQRPGDVLARLIHWLGFAPSGSCGCASMQTRMNGWGWLGCWRERGVIVAHLAREAAGLGIDPGRGVRGLLVAAWRAGWRKISA